MFIISKRPKIFEIKIQWCQFSSHYQIFNSLPNITFIYFPWIYTGATNVAVRTLAPALATALLSAACNLYFMKQKFILKLTVLLTYYIHVGENFILINCLLYKIQQRYSFASTKRQTSIMYANHFSYSSTLINIMKKHYTEANRPNKLPDF